MAKKFILQGVTADNHLDEICEIAALENIERLIISVAFLSQRGFDLLSDLVNPIAAKTIVLAGIRNGITSAQGLLACIECGCKTYAVDTGSRNVLFHPKVYLGRNCKEAKILLGSANLTVGGLNSNIEASVKMIVDLKNKDDAEFVADLEAKIDGMIAGFPAHVFEVKSREEINMLLFSGRLIDESVARPPSPGGSSKNRNLDTVPTIDLNRKKLKLGAVETFVNKGTAAEPAVAVDNNIPEKPAEGKDIATGVPVTPPAKPVMDELELVWKSNLLTRRPLNVPTAKNTNPTGSMYFTKGQTEGIDQRHYFREDVFAELAWENDTAAGKEHLERATAQFRIVIKDVNYGVFEMSLTHDSRKDSRTYLQNNSVTQLHWGDAKLMVARDDLLGRTLYLYRDGERHNQFVLEID